MSEDLFSAWLFRRLKREVASKLIGGCAIFVAGVAILGLTWVFSYMVSLFVLGPWLGYHHWSLSVVGLVLIVALFWGNARTSREYLSEYTVTTGTASDQVVNFYLPGVGMASNVNPLAPETIHTGVKMITDILYSGPRVVVAGIRMVKAAVAARRIDVSWCSCVIGVIFQAGRKVSFQEIMRVYPTLEPTRTFPQLHQIEGIIFLKEDPAGVTLTPELRAELIAYLSGARQKANLGG